MVNALVSINEVDLCAGPGSSVGWMAVCRQVNNLGTGMYNHLGQLDLPGKPKPACLAGVKAGRVHLCRDVAGSSE